MATKFFYRVESLIGEFHARMSLPDGKYLNIDFVKGKDGKFFCDIPEEVTYVDAFKQVKTFHPNYCGYFLDAYNTHDKNTKANLYDNFVARDKVPVEEVIVQKVEIVPEAQATVPDIPQPEKPVEAEVPKLDYTDKKFTKGK